MGKRAVSAQNKRLRKKFARLRGVYDAAVARILMKIKRNPGAMEDFYEGQDVAQSLRAEKIRSDNPTLFKEETLQMNDGSTFIWLYGDFQQLVIYFVETCPAFREAVAESLAKHPCSSSQPWHIVKYSDEIVPGNPMRQENERKVWGFYSTFREFGKARISQTRFWIPIAVLRSYVALRVRGGLSCVTRVILRGWFIGPLGWSTGGVVVTLHGTPTLLFAILSNLLGDEEALTRMTSTKGASGLVPCILCLNCVCKGNDVDNLVNLDTDDYLVDISCADIKKFDRASDTTVWEKVDVSQNLRVGNPEFVKRERAMGLTWNRHGLLADKELRPHVKIASIWTYDPTHNCYANGLGHAEIYQFLQCLKLHTVSCESIQDLMVGWKWPAFHKTSTTRAQAVFNKGRESSEERRFKGTASEILLVYPILR